MSVILDRDTGITVPAGTVSAPSITVEGDTNTGIYFPTTDRVSIAGGGTDILSVAPGKVTYASSALGAASAGLFEYDGRATYFTPVGTQRGVVPGTQLYRLNTTVAGANSTAVQKVFGVGVTLNSSTVYRFNAVYALSKTAGSNLHTIGISFGGTATLTNISYSIIGNIKAGGFPDPTAPDNYSYIQVATNVTVIAASSSTSLQFVGYLSGTVSINAGGTFIPQYQLSVAPGGAYTTAAGSFFEIWPVSQTGSTTSIGDWA